MCRRIACDDGQSRKRLLNFSGFHLIYTADANENGANPVEAWISFQLLVHVEDHGHTETPTAWYWA